MLPEFLFSVGSSMQDISRDDFSLLNGGCEKDVIVNVSTSNIPSTIASVTISPTTNIVVSGYNGCSNRSPRSQRADSPNLDTVVSSIKLEDCNNSDLYNTIPSWHHPHIPEIGSSKLLLRNSDDPLISRGSTTVDDDNPNEFKFIVNDVVAQTNDVSNETTLPSTSPKPIVITATTTPTTTTTTTKQQKKTTNKKSIKNCTTIQTGQPRTRRKGAFKLRFHHQALPAEYLSHYEESQNQLEARNAAAAAAAAAASASASTNNYCNNKDKNNSNNNKKINQIIQQNKQEKITNTTNENVRNWLQKISKMQAMAAKENHLNCNNQNIETMEIDDDLIVSKNDLNLSSTPISVQSQMTTTTTTTAATTTTTTRSPNQQPQQQPQQHQRVVKYSDLPYMGEMTLENSKPRRGRKPKKTDICHLIYKNYGTIFPGTPKGLMINDDGNQIEIGVKDGPEKISLLKKTLIGDLKDTTNNDNTILIDEPLNLCLRDQSESLTISSDEDESDDLDRSNSTTPLLNNTSPVSVTDAFLAANLKMSLPNFQSAMLDKLTNDDNTTTPTTTKTATSTVGNEKLLRKSDNSWPNVNNLFIHPMALYYKQMIDTDSVPSRKPNSPTIKKHQQLELSPKSLNKLSTSPKLQLKKEKPDNSDTTTCSTPNSIKSFTSSSAGTSSTQSHPPQKRKRSAIFIPPMPSENNTNPATEVSICKFKFTGGAKPSLQEKKMLSVDSDGNYRYYSGTGDKSTRGYEFFPRESLQQSGVIPGVNCSGAFLNATGEKISTDLPPSAGLSNELLQIPDTPPGALILPSTITTNVSTTNRDHNNRHHRRLTTTTRKTNQSVTTTDNNNSNDRRKRKSRRSLQREKLEKTFKDQGFLIQTQQLESAEGATYCKFRQLKKFTRYLFRSWKDYLPGELPASTAVVAAAAAAAAASAKVSTNKQQQPVTTVNPM